MIERGNVLRFAVGTSKGSLAARSLPTHATFDPATGEFIFRPENLCDPEDAMYVVTFVATDEAGAMTTESVQITVVERFDTAVQRPPIISAPAHTIRATAESTTRFRVMARSQEEGCTTTVTSSMQFDPSTGEFLFSPAPSEVGSSHRVTFTATDCAGRQSSTDLMLVVGR